MNREEFKAEWIKRLRSGDYKQHQGGWFGSLGEDGKPTSYCCLSVARDIVNPNGNWDGAYGATIIEDLSPFILNTRFLPSSLSERPDSHLVYAKRNDGTDNFKDNPQTFEQIADFIEENYK